MAKQSSITSFIHTPKNILQKSATFIEKPDEQLSSSTKSTCISKDDYTDSSSDSDELEDSSEEIDKEPVSLSSVPAKRRKPYKQKYSENYSSQFKWLIMNKDGNNYCKYCQKCITGSQTHLKRHESRSTHKNMVKSMSNTVDIRNYQENIEHKTFLKKVKECELKLTALVIEHNLPMLLMDHLPKLLTSAAPDSEILKNVSCSRTKTTCLLKHFQEESERTITIILKDRKYSIIVDETTDISVKKCLAIVVRYVDFQAELVRDRLLSLVEVSDLTAEGIIQKILDVLRKLTIPITNMVGFAADNASVMMGKYNGVQAKLREINPNIFVIGCICHSLHLSASAAAHKLPKEIEDFVRDVYNYISGSSKRLGEFKEFQEYVNIKPHKLLRPSQTRWLSLEAVVKRTLEQWPALVLYFNSAVLEDNLAAASNIHNALNNTLYKLYLTFLSYILPLINKLNLEFQAEKPKLYNVYSQIEIICKTIFKNFMNNEYVDRSPFLELNELYAREYKTLDRLYLGTNVDIILKSDKNLDKNDVHDFKLKCLSYYIELCTQMKKRFKNLDSYKCFKNLNPNVVLGNDASITDLLVRFPNISLDKKEEISSEFRELCNLPDFIKEKLLKLDFQKFWFEIYGMENSINEKCFLNVCSFVFGIFCLPHSSACAERIFSELNNIKTKNRSKLLPATCNALLQGKEVLNQKKCFQWTPSAELVSKKVNYN